MAKSDRKSSLQPFGNPEALQAALSLPLNRAFNHSHATTLKQPLA
ncbi:hypothetical protein ACNR0F_01805 [Kingella kingae]